MPALLSVENFPASEVWAADAIAQPEATCSSSTHEIAVNGAVRDRPHVSDFNCAIAGASVDLSIDDERTANSAADVHV